MNRQLWIDFDELSDRPDGQIDRPFAGDDPLVGTPLRGVRLGTIPLDERVAPVRLHRVKAADAEPVWLFSPHTVERIPLLHERYGPSGLDEVMPDWAKVRVLGRVPLWEWVAFTLLVVFGIAAGYLIQRMIRAAARRSPGEGMWYQRLMDSLAVPIALAVGSVILYFAKLSLLTLTAPVNLFLDPLLLILLVGSLVWLVLRALNFWTQILIRDYVTDGDQEPSGEAQSLLTRLSVAKRLITLIAILVVVGIVMIQLNLFDSVGYALLASAGLASVILGIAAQPVLGNVIAGLQIAITQPVRIGDSVVFEGNWGHVEEITFTYLMIRTWDKRRLIVPLQYLVSRPIENWTKVSSHLIQPIYLYVDYRTDVRKIRKKFAELVKKSDDWDEESEPTVQVTGCSAETMEVRALCAAKDPPTAWELHCEMREELIRFVQELDGGEYLPRRRLLVEGTEPTDNGRRKS